VRSRTGVGVIPFVDVLVLGGGLSGLNAAYQAQKTGSVLLLEASDLPGGKIQSIQDGPYLLEWGPNTFQSRSTRLLSLCQELGLTPLAAKETANRRFIYYQETLHEVPTNPMAFIASRLLSRQAQLRLLTEPFQRACCTDESIASFARRRFGHEVLNQMLGPFLSGIYAGDPEQLSSQALIPLLKQFEAQHGSLFKGALFHFLSTLGQAFPRGKVQAAPPKKHTLYNFPLGMASLTQALVQAISSDAIYFKTQATRIEKHEKGYQVFLSHGDSVLTAKIISTLPAYEMSALLPKLSEEAHQALSEISYAPMAIVHLGIPKSQFNTSLEGFGFLVAKNAPLSILGSLWMSSIFEGRAPEETHLLTVFIGGAEAPSLVNLSDQKLVALACRDLSRVFKVDLTPVYGHVMRHKKAIPQYTFQTPQHGHVERIRVLQESLQEAYPDILLHGNFINGVSLEACLALYRP
jgi:protoporphyrinogen/coproporphyrinogen III oxidase